MEPLITLSCRQYILTITAVIKNWQVLFGDILPPRHFYLRGKNIPLAYISFLPYYTIVSATLAAFSSNVMLDNATYSKTLSICLKRCG